MSIPVQLEALRNEAARHGPAAYLLTVGNDGRPHAVAVQPAWQDDRLVVSAGTRTVANATDRGLVSLLWWPHEPGGYSLIVDGDATTGVGDASTVVVTPTKAVLHRPAPGAATGVGCGSDCVTVI